MNRVYKFYVSNTQNKSSYQVINFDNLKDGYYDNDDFLNNYDKDGIDWRVNYDALYWFKHGKLHRETGPAAILNDIGTYYLEGIKYEKSEWQTIIRKQKMKTIL